MTDDRPHQAGTSRRGAGVAPRPSGGGARATPTPLERGARAAPERLDEGVTPAEAERALRDLRRVYRVLGARDLQGVLLAALARAASPWALDLGSGGGHVGDDLARRAARRGLPARVVGVDAKLAHLLAARRMGAVQRPVVGDAAALPLRDGTLAVAFSHLFFHHFDAAENRRVLAEMRRVARTVVVVDIARGWLARTMVRPLLRLLRLSPVAYADGVTSVARAYDRRELAAMVVDMPVVRLARRFPARWLLVLRGTT